MADGPKVLGRWTLDEWQALLERAGEKLGRAVRVPEAEFVVAYLAEGGNQTGAMRRVAPGLPEETCWKRGHRMAKNEAVQKVLDEIAATGIGAADITPDVVAGMIMRDYTDPEATVRDRLKASELAGRVGGAFRDTIEHRHLHLQRTPEEFIEDIGSRLGWKEAAVNAGAQIGLSAEKVAELEARWRRRETGEPAEGAVIIDGEAFEVLDEPESDKT